MYRSEFEPDETFFEFLKLDRLEMLSIQNSMFDDEDDKMFFQALGPLKNLKTLKLKHKYVQNAVLSDKIEALYLWWKDHPTDNSTNREEIINSFIRGPGVFFPLFNPLALIKTQVLIQT